MAKIESSAKDRGVRVGSKAILLGDRVDRIGSMQAPDPAVFPVIMQLFASAGLAGMVC